ncbi:MAG: ABC transporter ATP-binding protein [Fusobacterium sp.]|uniref:ABC transporter ATP-binding protein n=1 Tax=Fusobacterium sp. TaxID=68766 RepID=UPI0026DBA64D|nr:ABC transporter ATP-binding protein [Fusobacterium sp.]MDO4689796.1 ABC transporter ATP-binding protein [Fusobacterium sp.]
MLRKLLKYVGEYKKNSILAPIFISMEVLIEITIPFFMANIIDKGLNKNDMNYIFFIGGFTFILTLLSMSFGLIAGKHSARAASGFAKNIRKALFYKIQTLSFSNIDKFSTASLITRFTTDISSIQNSYHMLIRVFIRAPFMIVFATLMAIYISARLSLIYIAAILFMSSMLAFIILFVYPIFSAAVKKYDNINSTLQENIAGIRVVKSYVKEEYEIEKFKEATENLKSNMLKGFKIVIFISPLMQSTMYICTLFLSWLGAKMIISETLTTGQLMSLFVYTSNILINLLMLAMILVSISLSRVSAERIIEVLDEEGSIKNPDNPCYNIENANIEFKNVNFSYTARPEFLNLKNINIRISQGEVIGIIGGIGSSKSAFVQLIPRLYDVMSGEILIGNKNIKDYDLKTLRESISIVLQKNILFSGTIKENLLWGNKDASDIEIINAAKIAQIHDFIENLPNKYDSYIDQGGVNLSGGQKQRLCIARALLKKPKILILDDATNALDSKTDEALREALKKYLINTTKIIISQRISSIKFSDRIIVLDEGEIVGLGNHEELLKNNFIYKEIYESQIDGGSENE